MKLSYIIILKIVLTVSLLANTSNKNLTVIHQDINSTIERIEKVWPSKWDPLYYQYRIVNNIPMQFDKNDKTKKIYFFNPIYLTYFYQTYLYGFKKTKNYKYLNHINTLTNTAMQYSDTFKYHGKNVRTFYYKKSGNVARMFHHHYSALTNSHFVHVFSKIYHLTKNPEYKKMAIAFANSLMVPIEDGGVLYQNIEHNLTALAEVPTYPHGWILNGWLSSLYDLDRANAILKNKDITQLIEKNISTLDKMIDKFDVPSLCISRYNLTQFFYFRLLKKEYSIKKITFKYPLDNNISLLPQEKFISSNSRKLSRWQSFILSNKNMKVTQDIAIEGTRLLQFNGILSRSGYPEENKIIIEFTKPLIMDSFKFQTYIGKYNPLTSAPSPSQWIEIPKNKISMLSSSTIEISLPNSFFENILGYPTNFMKKFSNGRKNIYHNIHIKWLYFLGKKYHKSKLIDMADKWLKCKKTWQTLPEYKKLLESNNILIDNDFLQ